MMKHFVETCICTCSPKKTGSFGAKENVIKHTYSFGPAMSKARHLLMTLFFSLAASVAMAQTRTVSGDVTSDDDKKEPLIGVSVTVKGSTQGTVTDLDGNFSIEISEDNPVTLSFSYMGYELTEVPVGNQSSINVRMKPAVGGSALNDVVVIGYGTQKARNITGAVSTLSTENFVERPINRLESGLIGQIAGVQVKQTSGNPGQAMSINVRGTGSIAAGNEPLYVIDGFPLTTTSANTAGNWASGNPLDNINPNDIESIQVLKDAAAGAIYGSRAANGVVIINTKRGKIGKPQITFNTYFGFNQASKKLDMLTADEWIARAKGWIDDSWVKSAPGRTATQTTEERRIALGLAEGKYDPKFMYDARWDMPGHPGLDYIDWQDEAFRTGNFQNYQLSASGGTENVRYYISGNYQNQQGFVYGMGYKSFSGRANVEANLTKGIKFGINLAPTYSIRNNPGVEGKDNTLMKIITQTPVMENKPNANGALYTTAYEWGSSGTDPLSRLTSRVADNKMFRNLASIYADIDIINGLKFKSSVNMDNTDNTSNSYVPSNVLASITGSYGTSRAQTIVNENTLSYLKTFAEKHNFSVIAGHSYNTYNRNSSSVSSNGNYTSFATQTVPSNSPGSSSATKNVMISYFGRLQYDFMGKYLLSASIRRDGSSRFGVNTRWGNFPSVSAGWRVSDEAFMKNVGFISDLKLRASYGQAGNNNIGDYGWSSLLGTQNYSFGTSPGLGLGRVVSTIPNDNLTWEKSASNNYGVDFSLFNYRISGSFDYYTKRNTDLLLNVPILATTGYTTYLTNIGEVLNKGWEFELNTKNLTGKFQWNTNINFSHNNNKVTKLDGDQTRIEVGSSFTEAGYALMEVGLPMNSIYVVQQDGVLSQSDIEAGYPIASGQKVGDARYIDANGDGKITAADRVVVGQPNPKYFWGITNTFRYKGFDFSVLVQGQNGGKIYSLLGRAINLVGASMGGNVLDVDVATRGNYKTSYSAPVNTDWLYSSDYISIRSMTLGYDLSKVVNNKFIKGARVYVSAENFFYWDKYDGGFNPEATNANLSSDANYPMPGDYGGLPIAKSLVFGLNFNF